MMREVNCIEQVWKLKMDLVSSLYRDSVIMDACW